MVRVLSLLTIGTLFSFPVAAQDSFLDISGFADFRLTHAFAGEEDFFNGGLGKTRYGASEDGSANTQLRLSEISVLAKADIAWGWKAFAHLKFDSEQDKPVDLVEAFVTYKPVPSSAWSFEYKAGLFFPHISRENISTAWTTPYTITPSAINAWVGEEIRALGLEARATYKTENHKVSLSGAIFGFNDPAGSLLAFRGWALHDAKVGAFSTVPLAPIPSIGTEDSFLRQAAYVNPIRELDNKPGFYAALDYSYGRNIQLGAFYYDNRGNPEAFNGEQYAWDTRFLNVYAEANLPSDIKFISQYMRGSTEMGVIAEGDRRYVDVDFKAAFALLSKTFGPFRLSARYDWFDNDDNSFIQVDNNFENGDAYTVAFSWRIDAKNQLLAEYLQVNSDRDNRVGLGVDTEQKNKLLQFSFRRRF